VLTKAAKAKRPTTLFVKGQLWKLPDERVVKIGHVGRRLLHHRTLASKLGRPMMSRESISTPEELQRFLTDNKAVLVEVET
jgi:hypothetical protein